MDTLMSDMARQPRRSSAIEAATQALIGLPIGFGVTFTVEQLHLPPAWSAASITTLMFLLSALRGYLIRRRFDRSITINERSPRL
jgi:Flp pilus assembly protein TadB